MKKIVMVDLIEQSNKIQKELAEALNSEINTAAFINSSTNQKFQEILNTYNNSNYTITCANGTDALQIAFMSLDLKPGDEIIFPAFTYIAAIEAAVLLGLKPVLVDVDANTFNINTDKIITAMTERTRAIVPVHLFGQCCEMENILEISKDYQLYCIEDAAQSIGSNYRFSDGNTKNSGTMGIIGTTSFFPSKTLGCFGDGGAIYCQNVELAEAIKSIANHGQREKYLHERVGINSRLDSIQAAILSVKIKYLDNYIAARRSVADFYDKHLKSNPYICIPIRSSNSLHTFHQYTIKVKSNRRDSLRRHLHEKQIPTMIYYPLPVYLQPAYQYLGYKKGDFPVAEELCEQVLSLPMHTELDEEQLNYITNNINKFFEYHV